MPLFDLKCDTCGRQIEAYVSNWKDALSDQWYWCGESGCAGKMIRLRSAPNFIVSGYNAKNGYSK